MTAPIWRAVSTLESELYTREEIAEKLREVADELE